MTELDKAMAAFRADGADDSSQSAYYSTFLNTTFCVPTLSEEQAREFAPEAAAAGESLPLVIEADGNQFLMLFDTLERMHAWTQAEVPYVEIPGHMLASTSRPPLHWALNVGTEYVKSFVPDEIAWLKEVVEQSEAKMGEGEG